MKKSMKLGTRLNVAFLVVLFVPMIIATSYSIIYYSNKIKKEAMDHIGSDMKVAMLIYSHELEKVKNLAVEFASDKILMLLFDLDLSLRIGEELLEKAKNFELDLLTVIDLDGKVVARAHSPEKYGDIINYRHFLEAALSNRAVSTPEVLSPETMHQEGFGDTHFVLENHELMSLTGIAPVYNRDHEQIVGAVIVRRLLNSGRPIVSKIHSILNVEAAVFTKDALVSYEVSDHPDTLISEYLADPEIRKSIFINSTSYEKAVIAEDGYLTKYQLITDLNDMPIGSLMVRHKADRLVRTQTTAIMILLWIGIAGVLLAMLVKFFIERQILIPILDLQKGTERIANGDYSRPIEIISDDEIGSLSRSFNQMAVELEERNRLREHFLAELEIKVKERTHELKKSREQWVRAEKMAGLSTLVAGMSHELNNPLAGVLQSLQNVIRRLSPDSEKNCLVAEACGTDMQTIDRYIQKQRIRQFLDFTRESGTRATRIISEILQFCSSSEDRLSTKDLNAIVSRTLLLLQNDLPTKKRIDEFGIQLRTQLTPDLPKISCVELEISQVLMNLIQNSIQAIAAQETRLQSPQVLIKTTQVGDQLKIEVQDNGLGMDEATAKQIFDPFFTSKSVWSGLGLGLFVSYFIITENHRGTIDVESELGKGTNLIIHLPLNRGLA